MGVPAGAVAGQEHVSQVHQVDAAGKGHLQAGGLQGRVQAVGQTQEQARYELRDHGPSLTVGVGDYSNFGRDFDFSVKTITTFTYGNRLLLFF